jgi:gliding motility-associated-like protein
MMNVDAPGQNCVDRSVTFPDIALKVEKPDGTLVGVYDIGKLPVTITPRWKRYSVYFTAPDDVSNVVLKLIDNLPGGCGNDFALDDVLVRHCETQRLAFYGLDTSVYVKELGVGQAESITLTCNLSSGSTNSPIKWQESTDRGKTWKNIQGANSNTYVKYFPASTPVGYYLYRSVGTEELTSGSQPCRITSNVLTVHIIKTLFIPNAFSPNGDGVNDTWVIQAVRALSGFELTVFDRTGAPVFQTNNYNKHWDGTYNGRLLPLGTYYYFIDFRDGLPKQKGYVTLVR